MKRGFFLFGGFLFLSGAVAFGQLPPAAARPHSVSLTAEPISAGASIADRDHSNNAPYHPKLTDTHTEHDKATLQVAARSCGVGSCR